MEVKRTVRSWGFREARRSFLSLALILIGGVTTTGQTVAGNAMRPVDYVNPLIGTAPMTVSAITCEVRVTAIRTRR